MRTNRGTFPAADDKTGHITGIPAANVPPSVTGTPRTGHIAEPGGAASPQVSAVLAAVAGGAGSWAATGRQAGVSRQRARAIGRRHGVAPDRRGARAARVNVRVRPDAVAALDARAAAWGVSRSEAARRILSAALSARPDDVR